MKTYTLILLLIAASSQLINCGPLSLNSKYHNVYSYEVLLSTVEDGVPKNQVSITSEFDLHPTSKLTYDITLKNVASKTLGDSLDPKLVEELQKKFSVTIVKLPVGEYSEVAVKFADSKESPLVKNIKRGLVALLTIDYRKEATYRTTQSGLLGRCDNEYSVSRTPKIDGQSSIYITRTRLKDTCKASKQNQYVSVDKTVEEAKTESKSDYLYELIETDDDTYIKHADLDERLSLRYNSFRNLTSTVISKQKVHLLSREKHGAGHTLRKRQFPTFPIRIPTIRPFQRPTLPSITEIVQGSKEAIENAVHKVIDGVTVTNLEAEVIQIAGQSSIDDVAERFNAVVDTLKVVETEDVEKLQLGYKYAELKNYLSLSDKKHLLDVFKSDKIKADPKMRRRVFFQVLSLLSQHAAFQVAKEIVSNDLKAEDTVKQFAIDTITVFFTSRTRSGVMTNEQAKEVYDFCKQGLTLNNVHLYKACYLYLSRMASVNYLSGHLKLKEVEDFEKKSIADLVGDVNKAHESESPVKLLLAVKSVKNFRTPHGLEFLRKLLMKPSAHHFVRVEAAWGLKPFDVETIKDDLLKILYNQTECTEIRLAIFHTLLSKHGADLIPFVTRLKVNFLRGTFIDDKQLVTKIHTFLRHALMNSGNEADAQRQRNARILFDTIKEDYKEYLGLIPDDLYHRSYLGGKIEYAFSTIKSKDSLFPETYYLAFGDSFDSSQYIVRSRHGDLLQYVFSKPAKSAGAPDARIQDAILNIVQQLHLSLKDSNEHSYAISRRQNQYEVYFVYGDENNHLYATDLIAFRGNGVHLKYSVFASSFTESGLPYFMVSSQLSITRLIPSENGLNLLRSTGGYSATDVFTSLSKSHLVSGKLVEETLRYNLHLGFGMEMASANSLKLNGSISLLNADEGATTLYYKGQRFINKVISENFMSLHVKDVDQFDAENYDQVITRHGDFVVEKRFPIGRNEENVFHSEDLMKVFKAIGSIVSRKRYSYDVKVTFKPDPPHRALIWDLNLLKGDDSSSAKLLLSHDEQKLHSLWIRRTIDVKERTVKCEVVTKNFRKPLARYLTATATYPIQNFDHYFVKDFFGSIPNATVTGAYYTGTDLDAELGKKPEDLYLSFKGTFSKRNDKRDIREFERAERLCYMRNDFLCREKVFRQTFKYNRLELDVDIAKSYSPGEHTALDDITWTLLERYKQNMVFDQNKKTEGLNKARIELNIRRELRRNPTADYTVTRFWGEGTFKNVPAKISPLLFGYSVFEYNMDIANKFPYYRPPICIVNSTGIETFDGNKQILEDTKSCKPHLIAADCSKYKFFVTRHGNVLTVLYDHNTNVTFIGEDIYVNDKKEEIPVNTVQEFPNFRLMRYNYVGLGGHILDFGSLRVLPFGTATIVRTTPFYKNHVCGICGNNDGDWSNDIVSSKNEYVTGEKFVESWAYGDDQKC